MSARFYERVKHCTVLKGLAPHPNTYSCSFRNGIHPFGDKASNGLVIPLRCPRVDSTKNKGGGVPSMAGTNDGPELHSTTLELAQGANFAAITPIMPDGDLQNHYI